MARPATGELRHLADGSFAALITIEGRTRKPFRLEPRDEADARERCTALAEMAARIRRAGHVDQLVKLLDMGAKARPGRPWEAVCAAVDRLTSGVPIRGKSEAPTMTEFARQWTSGELAKKYPDHIDEKRTAGRDKDLLRLYVLPHVKDVRVHEFTLEDAEHVMASIPAVYPAGSRKGKPVSAGQRRHIAQTMARLMRLAVYPCRLRKDNPIPSKWLPKGGGKLALECLYPDEETLLLAGRLAKPRSPRGHLTEVPLQRRIAYGVLTREGMRVDELGSMQWRDVDLERGRIVLDENKTDDPRDWDLQPDVVFVLTWWKARQGESATPDSHVLAENGVPLATEHLAQLLRDDLERVGVTRPQLFETKPGVRLPIRAHDLRATFVTIALATGKTETWISDRTGHQSHEMVDRYRRKARTWNLGPLAPFHEALPEMTPNVIDTTGELVEEPPPARALPPAPTRLPLGLPLKSMAQPNSQRAQRKPMP